jgi:hypothetical protein
VSGRGSDAVFDADRFRADVTAHMDRWHLTGRQLASSAGIHHTTLFPFLDGIVGPSVLVVCSLANACDLALDSYRIDNLTEVA